MARRVVVSVLARVALATSSSLAQAKRPLAAGDLFRVREVRDPRRSPG